MKNSPKFITREKFNAPSAMQESILSECFSADSNTLYVAQMVIRMDQQIQPEKIRWAINTVINNYSNLRSSFSYEELAYIEKRHEVMDIPMEVRDLSLKTILASEEIFSHYCGVDLERGFDLSCPPLMRFAIFQFPDNETRIVWTRHHVLMDGRTASMLLKQIFQLYYGPDNAIQGEQEKSEVQIEPVHLNNDLYWKQALKHHGCCGLRPRPTNLQPSSIKNSISIYTTRTLFEKLKAFKLKQRFSLNTIILAAWSTVIANYSNNSYVVLGSVRDSRVKVLDNRIGLYINTLPVVGHIDSSMTVNQYITAIRSQARHIKAQASIASLAQIKRSAGISSDKQLFDVIVDYKPFSIESVLAKCFPAINFTVELNLQTPHAMSLEVVNHNDSLLIKLYYDSGLYQDEYANGILQYFLLLLDHMLENPYQLVAKLPSLLKCDYKKVIYEWNQTKKNYYAENTTVVSLFERTVEQYPQQVAMVFNNNSATYDEINKSANQLAHYLIENGVLLGDIVGIYFHSSIDAIVAIIAILKCGGTYLPLDPTYPMERISYYIVNSGVSYIVTHSSLRRDLCGDRFNDIDIICSDVDLINAQLLGSNPNKEISSSDLAYIIYTSGTSGQPKGVMIEHHSLVNLVMSQKTLLGVTKQSRVLQFASLSFDASVSEIFVSLSYGASLYIISQSAKTNESSFISFVNSNLISVLTIPPSFLRRILPYNLPAVETIVTAGESVSNACLQIAGQVKLLNGYGPTEATVCAAMKQLRENIPITIGSPMPNTKIYILTDALQPVPINVIGEIYIGGEGLARGYIGDTQETQLKFVKDPFSCEKGARLYKTGDMGCWCPNGEIEFIGRRDEVRKINGYRISLIEIESVLMLCPGIRQVAVAPHLIARQVELIAFIIADGQLRETNIKYFLLQKLPYYMVPSKIIFVDNIPLTLSNKINRSTLIKSHLMSMQKTPDISSNNQDDIIEFIVFSALKVILGDRSISRQQNLFDLGLESLDLYRLCSIINTKISTQLKPVELFIYSSPDSLVNYIHSLKSDALKNSNINTMLNSKFQRTPQRVVFQNE